MQVCAATASSLMHMCAIYAGSIRIPYIQDVPQGLQLYRSLAREQRTRCVCPTATRIRSSKTDHYRCRVSGSNKIIIIIIKFIYNHYSLVHSFVQWVIMLQFASLIERANPTARNQHCMPRFPCRQPPSHIPDREVPHTSQRRRPVEPSIVDWFWCCRVVAIMSLNSRAHDLNRRARCILCFLFN